MRMMLMAVLQYHVFLGSLVRIIVLQWLVPRALVLEDILRLISNVLVRINVASSSNISRGMTYNSSQFTKIV